MNINETTITLGTLIISNIVGLVAGIIKLSSRLTRIETDVKWIVRNCDFCKKDK